MSTLYRIRDWDKLYENNKTRERDQRTWCSIPNKQDGLGYGRLVSQKDGPALYGAFIAVVLVASKQTRPRDGYLTDTGRSEGVPYDSQALAIKTRMPIGLVARMLTVLSDPTICWLEVCGECPDSAREVPAECPPAAPRGEERRREEKRGEKTPDDGFAAWYEDYFRKEKGQEAETAWRKLNDEEKAKALQVVGSWCRWKTRTDARKWWPLPASWLNGKRFDDDIPLDRSELCTRCGKEPRRPDSDMGDRCFKELGLGG
jgi:hypothetical protein